MNDQLGFGDCEFNQKRRTTRKERFLAKMELLVPWERFEAAIEPFYPKAGKGRHPYPLNTMLRVHLLQQWYGLSDPGMEDALYETTPLRLFAHLSLDKPIPDESTIMNFRHLLEENQLGEALFAELNSWLSEAGVMLREGTLIDATIIEAPTSTKNKSGKRDPDMHQTKKGNEWHFGMKAHIGVDAASGLTHHVVTTPANTHDITEAGKLLHDKEDIIIAGAGYRGIEKREEHQDRPVSWAIAERPGKLKELKKRPRINALSIALEKAKARTRAAVEHPFRIIKCQFGFTKTRYRGLKKNHNKLMTLFALANIVRLGQLVKN